MDLTSMIWLKKNPPTQYGSDNRNKQIYYGGFMHVSAYSNQSVALIAILATVALLRKLN